MTDLIPAPNSAPDAPRHYKIGRKMDAALRAYVTNGANQAKAAEEAGIARETLCRALQKQHIKDRLASLVDEYKQRTGLKALARLDYLIDAEKVSPYVQLEAAKTMADRAGHALPKGDGVADTTLIVNIRLD